MKIKSLKINAFGNLKEKEIELTDHINIIQGRNEAGKSTLLKFMVDMFYGISKNKRGKEFSDYDRYKPWQGEEFSGKLTYCLENGEQYEIFREFNKKNPKIYNKESVDISKEFTIDKTYGNQFFYEQTNIDEQTFLNTFVSMQQEVKLEKQEQNRLLQKLANLAGTGDDNVSYKKAIEKITKKQIEEIGTLRTTGRPMNLVKEEKFRMQDEIGELEEFKNKQYELEELKQNLEENIKQNEEKLKIIKELRQLEDTAKIEKQKIDVNQNIINANNEKIKELEQTKSKFKKQLEEIQLPKIEKINKNNTKNIICILLFIISIILAVMVRNIMPLMVLMAIISILSVILLANFILKNKKTEEENKSRIKEIEKKKQESQSIQSEIDKLNLQIELLVKNNKEQELDIQKANDTLNIEIEKKKIEITQKYKQSNINDKELVYKQEEVQSNINKAKLEIHSLELDKNSIIPKLEKLASMEEKLEELNEKEKELTKQNEAIELTKQILELAYMKMKENITPKFTQNLSKNIEKISNGKYKNVKINDEEGIIIEKENGEYIACEKLSVGTIDQLYISLRLGAVKELTEEKMPIILDEAFAYYDEERLCNILKYISEEFKNHQIIIFTCTNREREILERLKLQYKSIEL